MLKRLARDESGVALGLAIIMVVLIGVMGAGLLVFVNTDLQNVIEVNGGQKAFDTAEAGLKVGKQHLLSDASKGNYDGNSPTPDGTTDSPWSSAATSAKQVTFDGNTADVQIQYLEPTPHNDPSKLQDQSYAPELLLAGETDYKNGRNYFRVISTGHFGNDAKRKVEAIYYTSKLDVPTAYYTPKNIEFNGNPTISGVSFFAGGNIILGSNTTVNHGPNALYQDWDTTNPAYFTPTSKLNTVPRRTGPNATDPTVRGAGFGAEGLICEKSAQCSVANSVADGKYDYDSTTATKGSQKKFIRKSSADIANNVPNASGTITYPFNPYAKFDLETLKQIAKSQNVSATKPQGNYYEGDVTIDSQYPNPSTDQTVFYVDAKGGDVTYKVNNTPVAKGLIVVENGNFDLNNSSNGFDGVIIVTGTSAGNALDCNAAGATGCYKNSGNKSVKGFVVADNTMTIRGTVDPFAVVGDYSQRPGFYGVKLWNWRELYQ